LFLYLGGEGSNDINGSFNGGGGLTAGQDKWGRSGGGATDIRLVSSNWNDFNSLKSRIMVAAGGGGANDRNYTETGTPYGCGNGGFGGSLTGGNGVHVPNSDSEGWFCLTYGATQTFGGTGIEYKNGGTTTYNSGCFGSAILYEAISQAGGGGGYYGGANSIVHCGGSGGSSFISGYSGCNAIKESSTESNIVHSGSPNHYSGYVFTNSVMVAGNAIITSPTGGTEIGHNGNGYCVISWIP